MTDKLYATDHYRWVQHPDGREQLQRGWMGDGTQEWRIASPLPDPLPPKIFTSDAEWIGD